MHEEFSSKAAEESAVTAWAVEIVLFMTDAVKERFLFFNRARVHGSLTS